MKFASYSDGSATWAEDLVNTYNLVRKREKLPDTATLAELLIEHGIRLSSVPTDKDLAAARALRPVLREVFDTADEEHAVALLNRILADHHAVPHYTHHDGSPWHLHVADEHASPSAAAP